MEWIREKNNLSMRRHHILFEEAKAVFNGPNCFEIYASLHSIDDNRYTCTGDMGSFCRMRQTTRIISAQQANKDWYELYYEHCKRALGVNQEYENKLRCPCLIKGSGKGERVLRQAVISGQL